MKQITTANPNNQVPDYYPVLQELLARLGKEMTVKRDEIVLREGQKCDFFFYVIAGVFRAYRWADNKEVTIGFSFTGDIDTSPYAYINDTNSADVIEAVTDCTIVKVYKRDILRENLAQPILSFSEKLLAEYIETLVRRTIAFHIKTAEANYMDLIRNQPDLVAHIELRHIASYLGISKERLSRIRKKAGQLT